MKENGLMTKLMDKEFTPTRMAPDTAEAGMTTNNTGKDQKPGQMEQLLKVNTTLERKMEKENSYLLMAQFMRAISNLTKFQDLEPTSGSTVKSTKESGPITRCMGKDR